MAMGLVEWYNMISECINNNIPPQMKTLNIVIPILMHYRISEKGAHLYKGVGGSLC